MHITNASFVANNNDATRLYSSYKSLPSENDEEGSSKTGGR